MRFICPETWIGLIWWIVCFTICSFLLGLMGIWQKWLGKIVEHLIPIQVIPELMNRDSTRRGLLL